MTTPPPKPPNPFRRGADGRQERKGERDGAPDLKPADFHIPGKGAPRPGTSPVVFVHTQKKEDEGYDSTAEELPQSYFEGMSRERDRKQQADPQERKRQRDLARNGWSPAKNHDNPAFYVRSKANRFEQLSAAGGGHCKAICGAYIYLRYLGYSVQQTIAVMKSKVVAPKFSSWHRDYKQAHRACNDAAKYSELSGVAAKLYSQIAADLRACSHRFPERLNAADPLEKLPKSPKAVPDIFFEQIIGQFAQHTLRLNAQGMQNFQTAIQIGSNVVLNRPHAPPSKRADTFQAALFSSYQACVRSIVPQADYRDKKSSLKFSRAPTPFVELSLYFRDEQKKPAAHSLVVDFSDAAHPGIFDPNFGWMEPIQGRCFLSLEQALHSIWEFYTGNGSRSAGARGVKHLTRLIDPDTYLIAKQIFVQSGLAASAGEHKTLHGK